MSAEGVLRREDHPNATWAEFIALAEKHEPTWAAFRAAPDEQKLDYGEMCGKYAGPDLAFTAWVTEQIFGLNDAPPDLVADIIGARMDAEEAEQGEAGGGSP